MKCFYLCFLFMNISLVLNAQDSTQYALFPGAEIYLPPGGKASFFIAKRNNIKEAFAQVPVNFSTKWAINGKDSEKQDAKFGKLTLQIMSTNTAYYTAPSTPPGPEPVIITVEFSEQDIDSKSTNKTKNILVCTVHILDAPNFFFLSGGNNKQGTVYELKEPVSRINNMAEVAIYGKDQWNISISGFSKAMKPMSMALSIAGNGKGNYEWVVHGSKETGLIPPATMLSVSSMPAQGSPFQFLSTDCTPHGDASDCVPYSLKGLMTITELDPNKKIIRGYFCGQVMSVDFQYQFISGGFRAYIH